MPRWARFLSCSFTGLTLSFSGFLFVAYWWEGGAGYWRSLMDFATEPAFWHLLSIFALMAAATLVASRLGVRLYQISSPLSGALAGSLVALLYVTVLISIHATAWGGLIAGARRAWPAAVLFMLPFALSGGVVTWLWERLN